MLCQKTIGMLIRETVQRWPHRNAVMYGGICMTYQALYDAAGSLARWLLLQGVHPGAHIGLLCAERPSALICLYACARAGFVSVLLNSAASVQELASQLSSADVKVLLHGYGYADIHYDQTVSALKNKLSELQAYCVGDALETLPLQRFAEQPAGNLLTEAENAVRPEDPCAILFTSGTTGASCPVVTSHFSRYNSAVLQSLDLRAVPEDRFCAAIPYFHCFSLSANIFAAAAAGACICMPETRHSKDLLSCLTAFKCTVLHGVPTLFLAMMANPAFAAADLSALRIGLIGGSACMPEQLQQIRAAFGYDLLPSLGMTEATAGITVAAPEDEEWKKLHTVGRFMRHIEGVIKDPDTGVLLPAGQTGEICVRGYCVMQGYYGMPEKTAQVIDSGGFLHSGDLGYVDPQGYLHYVGRRKELIIRSGENIVPSEIENVLLSDHRIAQVRVIGLPDPFTQEAVCACVVAESTITAENVQAIASQSLAAYKVPKYVVFLSDLPRSPNGKVRLGKLRQMAMEQLREDNKTTRV